MTQPHQRNMNLQDQIVYMTNYVVNIVLFDQSDVMFFLYNNLANAHILTNTPKVLQ